MKTEKLMKNPEVTTNVAVRYHTSDGFVFDNGEEAEQHQAKVNDTSRMVAGKSIKDWKRFVLTHPRFLQYINEENDAESPAVDILLHGIADALERSR